MALEAVGWGKAEELVTALADSVTKLIKQILVHKLNPEVAAGYEHTIHEILKDGAQAIALVTNTLVAGICQAYHFLFRQRH
jgi:hypothetical protein